jgi:hypothetical protein
MPSKAMSVLCPKVQSRRPPSDFIRKTLWMCSGRIVDPAMMVNTIIPNNLVL